MILSAQTSRDGFFEEHGLLHPLLCPEATEMARECRNMHLNFVDVNANTAYS